MTFAVTAVAQLAPTAPGPSWWTVVATVAAVVAAGTAFGAVIYARSTVVDGRAAHRELMKAQREASDDFTVAHREAMGAQQVARDDFTEAHREAMAAQTLAREDFAAGRAEEMAERKRALDAQIALERLAQAGRITEILITIARTAHDETLSPPPAAARSGRHSSLACRLNCARRWRCSMPWAVRSWKPQTTSQVKLTARRRSQLKCSNSPLTAWASSNAWPTKTGS